MSQIPSMNLDMDKIYYVMSCSPASEGGGYEVRLGIVPRLHSMRIGSALENSPKCLADISGLDTSQASFERKLKLADISTILIDTASRYRGRIRAEDGLMTFVSTEELAPNQVLRKGDVLFYDRKLRDISERLIAENSLG
jgi:hypothetical protein